MKMPSIDALNRVGRPLLRLAGVAILIVIGIGIAAGVVRWGFLGLPLPPVPGEAILMLLVPQIPQVVDQITRSAEKRSEVHANFPAVNPHGGPNAP